MTTATISDSKLGRSWHGRCGPYRTVACFHTLLPPLPFEFVSGLGSRRERLSRLWAGHARRVALIIDPGCFIGKMEFKGKGFPAVLFPTFSLGRGDPTQRRRRTIAQRAVRSHGVVMRSQNFDDNLSFFERIENLPVQTLVAQLAVERFTVSVFPTTPRLDKQRSRAYCLQPALHPLRRHFAPLSDRIYRTLSVVITGCFFT